MTAILGINAYHGDAAAALVVDGKLVAAVEEERFNRIKHWAGFPAASIRWCLEQGGVLPSDLDHVAISFNPCANMARRLGFVLTAASVAAGHHRPHEAAEKDTGTGRAVGEGAELQEGWFTGHRFIESNIMRRILRRDF